MGRERRGEKPAVRGRAGPANGERGRRRARRGGGGGALFQWGSRVGRAAAERSGAERSCEAPTRSRRVGGREAERGFLNKKRKKKKLIETLEGTCL